MKSWMIGVAAAALLVGMQPASALVADGITYTLTENSITNGGLTANFTFTASGENTASDTEGGGRTGINALAFNQPSPGTVVSGTMTSPTGFTFQLTGLNSGGCAMNANPSFFCFDNGAIPPIPTTLLSGTQIFTFSVTADTAGVWTNYTTDLKIDWVGSQNNYDLVSLPITVTGGGTQQCANPPCTTSVMEPGSMAMLGSSLVGMLGGAGWINRRRRNNT
jgi:hypothetical protein